MILSEGCVLENNLLISFYILPLLFSSHILCSRTMILLLPFTEFECCMVMKVLVSGASLPGFESCLHYLLAL